MLKLFSKNQKKRDYDKVKEVCRYLRKIKFFSQRIIPAEGYTLLVECMEHVYCPRGKLVYKEEESVENLYILLIGKASVCISKEFDSNLDVRSLKRVNDKSHRCRKKEDQEFLNKRYQFLHLKKGDSFGDHALIHNTSANDTIFCHTNCHFACLSRSKFEEVFRQLEVLRNHEWKNFFKSTAIFEHLTLKPIEKLFYFCELRTYKRNQTIFSEGDQCKGFFIIYQGIAQITKSFIYKRGGADKNSSQTRQDRFFGSSKLGSKRLIKLKSISEGQFMGIEDTFGHNFIDSKEIHSYNAVCHSAEIQCFYFTKEKAYDKLASLGCLTHLCSKAKISFLRMKELFYNLIRINRRIDFTQKERPEFHQDVLNLPSQNEPVKVIDTKRKETAVKKQKSEVKKEQFRILYNALTDLINKSETKRVTNHRPSTNNTTKVNSFVINKTNISELADNETTATSMNCKTRRNSNFFESYETNKHLLSKRKDRSHTQENDKSKSVIADNLKIKEPSNRRNLTLCASFYPAVQNKMYKTTQKTMKITEKDGLKSPLIFQKDKVSTAREMLTRRLKFSKMSVDTQNFRDTKLNKLVPNSFKLKSPILVEGMKDCNRNIIPNPNLRFNLKRHFMPVACSIPSNITTRDSRRLSIGSLVSSKRW
ncbi:unnamed protein product [Moneuplotes crassus]|uniref:Cyclic nucleotide-binding domain-containing protein n=1 Tax=Euplotes crassus TaxID=5936 RepID=A0AAD1Y5W3_EUPCR|nr:unnamed protein product [Moneuplotes crassus]